MKLSYFLIITIALLTLSACEQKEPDTSELIMDKIDDALDRRPNEKARDAIEDFSDSVNNTIDEFHEELEEITKKLKKQDRD